MKKSMTVIISIIIGVLITLLGISFSIKNIFINTANDNFTSDEVSSRIISAIKTNIQGVTETETNEIISEISTSNEMKTITEKYMDTLMDDISNGTSSTVDITDEVTSLTNHILSKYNISETMQTAIKEKLNSIKFNTIYERILYEMTKGKTTSSEYKIFIEVYNFIISIKLRIILIVSILVLIALACLINKSVLKIINILSTSLLMASMLLFVINIVAVKFIPPLTYNTIGKPIDIALEPLIIENVVYFVAGLAIGKTYDIIYNFYKK